MSYFNHFWQTPRDPRAEHAKAWDRTKAIAWDAKWEALSAPARLAFATKIPWATKERAATRPGLATDKLTPEVVQELTAAGFVKVETWPGKRSDKVFALSATYDFSMRLRSIIRYRLLSTASSREELTKYAKYAFFNQGETIVRRVLSKTEVEDDCGIDEAMELYVTSQYWPDWALLSIESKVAGLLLDALRKTPGPVKMADLPKLVPSASPTEIREALTDLIVHFVVFEDVHPDSLALIVGLFPAVKNRLITATKPAKRPQRPPLVVCEKPKEIGPTGGLEVNDLRVFLLEVAGEPPRLKQDGSMFQKEDARFLEALAPHPAWLDSLLQSSPQRRLAVAFSLAQKLGFTTIEIDDNVRLLRLSTKGQTWLSAGIEDQYGTIYTELRTVKESNNYYSYYDLYGDARFFGIPVSVHLPKDKQPGYLSYYTEVKPAQREALRKAIHDAFEALPLGVYHRWDSVLNHLATGGESPLTLGADPKTVTIFVGQRQIPRLPEQVLKATQLVLETFMMKQLLPFDAFRPAIDDEGKLYVARLPRFSGYFGKPYKVDKEVGVASTRVIVQPDFSILVIGLDPAPAAELAPFCERAGGHAGEGVLTFKITRNAVIRATSQGLPGTSIVARLKKHASVDVPANVLREVQEWAGWVRLVNVNPIVVVRCPDKETVARVVSALGKKAERLSDSLVALHMPRLTPSERQKLLEQGVLVTKEDITVAADPAPPSKKSPKKAATGSKRGRPKKIY